MSGGRGSELKHVLEQEIVTGDLPPGTRLDEMSLAERFGVSRTPVRQALHELSSIGLVDVRPRRGAVVAAIGLKDLLDMFEVMAELEGLCGTLAARRATVDEQAELKAVHARSEAAAAANDPDGYYAINVDFHETIYRASHNRFLAEQTRQIRNRLAPYRRLQLRQANRLAESFAEHAAITDAVCRRDDKTAGQLLRGHVTTQSGSFTDFVASLPSDLMVQAG